MREVNLLRWRLAGNDLIQPFRAWVLILALIGFFGLIHGYLSHANEASHRGWLHLKKTSSDTRFSENSSEPRLLQKKWAPLFDVLRCFEMRNIQVTRLHFQKNETTWTGWVDSRAMLSNALTACAGHQSNFSIDNVSFDYPKKMKPHAFSFVIH